VNPHRLELMASVPALQDKYSLEDLLALAWFPTSIVKVHGLTVPPNVNRLPSVPSLRL